MKEELLIVLRRWRRNWLAATTVCVLSSTAVALLLALAAVTDGVLYRQPFRGAERVGVLTRVDQIGSNRDYLPFEEASTIALKIFGLDVAAFDWPQRENQTPEAATYTRVTRNFFDVLGIGAIRGRTTLRSGDGDLAVVSYSFWQRVFGGAEDVVGRTVTIDRRQYFIAGVTEPGVSVPPGTDVWTPIDTGLATKQRFRIVGRWPDSTSRSNLNGRAREWQWVSLRDYLRPTDSQQLVILSIINALLLLVVWIHLALAQLGDTVDRIHEFRVRLAIGGSRLRVLRSGVADGVAKVLICAGGGVALAPVVLELVARRLPPELTTGRVVEIDYRLSGLLLFATAVGVFAVALATIPGMRVAFRTSAMLAGSRTTPAVGWSGRWIVGLQLFATTTVLYVCALIGSSFFALLRTDLGYRAENVLAIATPQPRPLGGAIPPAEEDRQAWLSRLDKVLADLRGVPGVIAVATSSDRPGLNPGFFGQRVWLPEDGIDRATRSETNTVAGEYAGTLGVPIRAGRFFDQSVSRLRPTRGWDETVIDTTLADALGGGDDLIGRELHIGGFPTKIIGIVGAIRPRDPEEPPKPRFYLRVSPANAAAPVILVRFGDAPSRGLRDRTLEVVKENYGVTVPPFAVLLEDAIALKRAPYLGRLEILSLAGAMTTALTVGGIFGVCAYIVAHRRREIAIRLAMGATRTQMLLTPTRGVFGAALAGSGAGILFGVFLGKQVRSVLYTVEPTDLSVLLVIVAVSVFIALVGMVWPTRNAWTTDLAVALRQD